MALTADAAAIMPLTRAMDRFAGALAAVGRGMENATGGGITSTIGSVITPAMNRDWGQIFGKISKHLDQVSQKYLGKAAAMAGPQLPKPDMRQNSLLDDAMGMGAPAAQTPGSKLTLASKALGGFTSIASKATGALTKFNTVTAVASAAIAAGKKIPGVGALASVGEAGFGMIGKRLTADFSAMMLPLTKFTNKAAVMATGLEEAGKASHAYSDAVTNSTGTIANAAQGFMKSFGEALSNPMTGLPALVGAVRPFVEAFNPYVLQQFDDALRTVYAVIGEALVPIVKMAAGVLREFAGYLRPVMKQLEPIFAELANMAGGFLKDIIPEIAKFAQELVPMFRVWLDQLKQSIGGQRDFMLAQLKYATGQIGLLDLIAAGIKSWLAKLPLIGGWFKPSQEEQNKAAAERAAANAQVPKENIFSFGAPTNPQFKAAEMLGRDTLQAAYGAMPGFEQKNDQIGLLQDIEKNTRKQVGLMRQMIAGLAKPISDTVRAASSVQEGAKVYDERVEAGGIIGGAQWAAGQTVEGVYNFGVGIGNLFTGKSWSEGMVDI